MSDLAWMRSKLAKLCGVNPQSILYDGPSIYWKPDEDVAQAIRCLEAMNCHPKLTRSVDHFDFQWNVWIGVLNGEKWTEGKVTHKSLAVAIVLAIAAALGWEKP